MHILEVTEKNVQKYKLYIDKHIIFLENIVP